MNTKKDLYAAQKATVKKIEALHRELDDKLPMISDFFFIAVVCGLGENVNLKQLYPELYKKVVTDMKGTIQDFAKTKRTSKTKELPWPSPVFQGMLKTKMEKIPKRKK